MGIIFGWSPSLLCEGVESDPYLSRK
jgi:hypothetical protein